MRGSVRGIRYRPLVHPRTANRLRKRHSAGRGPKWTGRGGPPCDNPAMSITLPATSRLGIPRLLALVLASVLIAAACGAPAPAPIASPTAATPSAPPSSPAPAPTRDLSAVYAEINRQVQEIRGLREIEPVHPRIVSPDEMAAILEKAVREETPPELLAATERLYRGLGLLPTDASLADVYVDLLESQVAGLYRPETKSLYVVSRGGDVGAVEQLFYAHEYQHALQDQHFDLTALQEGLEDQTDLQLARLALIEGDAYVLMTRWMLEHLGPDGLREVIEASNDPTALEALERIPPIVQAQILFPAQQGLQWILGIQSSGGWEAVDEVWRRPPVSTEQILHPEKYIADERPVPVSIPSDLAERMGAGWRVGLEDTMGELQLGIWLREALGSVREADSAAAGWGGDRIVLLDGPDGAWAIYLESEWDSVADAAEFAGAADRSLAAIGANGTVADQAGRTRVAVMLGSDSQVATRLDRLMGTTGN
jgi:hypothetical protein